MVFTLGMLAKVHTPAIIIPVLIVAGFAWTSTMATLNTSVQLAVPAWVQARALGTYLMTFQGGLALGSIAWGFVAEHFSTPIALLSAGAGLLVTLPFVHRFKILQGPVPDHTPYQWKNPAPQLAADSEATAGPVRVSVEYVIPLDRYAEFTRAIHELRGVRLRDGAIRWGVFRDAADPEKLNETFVMESWLDYLRSRERMTTEDVAIRDRVYSMNKDGERPRISHQIYAREVAGG